MSDGVTITSFEIENVKKVKVVRLDAATLKPTGLTLIGGDNGQGKTSVLEGIMGIIGGDAFKQPLREGADKGGGCVAFSNGIVARRTYTASGGSRLEVTDPTGKRGGQALLNEFVSPFALDNSEFLNASDKRKAEILLKVIGVNPQPFEERIRTLEADRLLKGRESVRAKGNAESLPYFDDAGEEKLDGNSISAQMTRRERRRSPCAGQRRGAVRRVRGAKARKSEVVPTEAASGTSSRSPGRRAARPQAAGNGISFPSPGLRIRFRSSPTAGLTRRGLPRALRARRTAGAAEAGAMRPAPPRWR